jgi:hypothetical protein
LYDISGNLHDASQHCKKRVARKSSALSKSLAETAPAPSLKPKGSGGSMSYGDDFDEKHNENWDADNANTPGVHWSLEDYVMIVLKQQDAERLESALCAFLGIRGTTQVATKLQRDLTTAFDLVRKGKSLWH